MVAPMSSGGAKRMRAPHSWSKRWLPWTGDLASHDGIVLAQDDDALEAELGAGCGELAAVIGLDDCAQHGRIASLGRGLGEGEFEVAGLVAAKGEAGQIVALDPYLRPPRARPTAADSAVRALANESGGGGAARQWRVGSLGCPCHWLLWVQCCKSAVREDNPYRSPFISTDDGKCRAIRGGRGG